MREYGSVPTSIWTNPAFATLSERGKLLAIYLISSPHTTMIGCFRLPLSYVSEDLNFDPGTVRELFQELLRNGFSVRDEPSKWVFIPTFLAWNKIENENQTKAAIKLFEQAPSDIPFMPLAFQTFFEVAHPLDGEKATPWRNRFETLSERFRNQKQKQEQNQGQEQSYPSQVVEPGEVVALSRTHAHGQAHTREGGGSR